jgi:acyl-CoA synthetase (AMP-forming)/AMP-acid ligase II
LFIHYSRFDTFALFIDRIRSIKEENVTIVWLLVPWAMDILFAVESGDSNLSDFKLDHWRMMHIGAQLVPPCLIINWKKVFPHHQYDTNYGLTEATGPGCAHLGIRMSLSRS